VAYVLVPEGFKLQKVTKAQKAAIDDYNRAELFKQFASAPNSGVIFIVAALIGIYFVAKELKIPGFNLKNTLLNLIPGVKVGELTPEQADTLRTMFREGALAVDADASAIAQLAFPTPEQRTARDQGVFEGFGI
jgi:hypothetical protein